MPVRKGMGAKQLKLRPSGEQKRALSKTVVRPRPIMKKSPKGALTAGFLLMGPLSGYLSDRFGARTFSTAGMLVTAAGFGGLHLVFGTIIAVKHGG